MSSYPHSSTQHYRPASLQILNSLLKQLACLRLELLLRRAENLLEDGEELRSSLLNSRVGLLVCGMISFAWRKLEIDLTYKA